MQLCHAIHSCMARGMLYHTHTHSLSLSHTHTHIDAILFNISLDMNESYHTYTHTHIHANAHTHTHTHSYPTHQTHGSNRSKSHITHEWLEWSQYYSASNLIERQSCLRISLLFAQCISTVVFACHVHNLVHGPTHIGFLFIVVRGKCSQ